jgi:quinoprotein dehydrogenase-associated probable ABC transporter substrate-binding protein
MYSGSSQAVLTLLVVVLGGGALDYHFWTTGGPGSRVGSPMNEGAPTAYPGIPSLRVCADPNNLPFSNRQRAGFEDALAELVAHDLRRSVEYTWWPQRRGFIRNTLDAGRCDVVMGIAARSELIQPTTPYYRSTYVFVTRRDRGLAHLTLDDPRLHKLQIGVHVIGGDYANVPPAQALAQRGIVDNVSGYSIYGDYSRDDPPRRLIDAVARREIDVAIAWGPLAGYFARREPAILELTPVADSDPERLPMQFDIAMGVRRGDAALKFGLDRIIMERRSEIERLLQEYDVPLLDSAMQARNPGSAARERPRT